ncbi:Vacuolar amino acid transporter 1 [Golovinomyces cichoracearum]|uniref:Vacuolar amino acid transporter 1 n=1 Tax=Golovinomyces cichoracearum TaxID=62708 RepID=A0A420JBJ9_9PEZI|nr:Vacuolar amino acid transporter 1 [Golovinomyces cichoracearum]
MGPAATNSGGNSKWNQNSADLPSETSALLDDSGEFVRPQSGEFRSGPRLTARYRMNSITQVGGVNSIENFARSWTRAATFKDVTSQQSYILEGDSALGRESLQCRERNDANANPLRPSLSHKNSMTGAYSPSANPNNLSQTDNNFDSLDSRRIDTWKSREHPNIYPGSYRELSQSNVSHIPSRPGSYGTSQDVLQAGHQSIPIADSRHTWGYECSRDQEVVGNTKSNDRDPVILREVEQDGKLVLMVAGQSTLPQTIFNSANVLIGIGILSLPLGFKYSGWILGTLLLSSAAYITSFTARLLSRCIDLDPSLLTFADIAFISFGENARLGCSVLFTMELIASCVGSIVLFADTLDVLIPGIGVLGWKIFCGMILIPLNFFPLRILSFSSFIGIICCCCIVIITIVNGLIKPHSPGSLREPATTNLFPENWLTVPLSFGLFMSPWGGHAVFPNIYRDMRHPLKYPRAVTVTFTFTYLINIIAAISGFLMFGDGVSNEISHDLINTPGYPQILSVILSTSIAIIPITKIPLNCNPITSVVESVTGIRIETNPISGAEPNVSPLIRDYFRVTLRIAVIVFFVIISILFPSFDTIMAFMGSSLCLTACVILPLVFYVKLFYKEIPIGQRILYQFLIILSTLIAIAGTVAAFIPKSVIGIE